jgi:transcriptional regulator with XRE-family HTH domain
MGRKLDAVISSLPAERQAKITALSDKKVAEMMAHAKTLTDFRKALGKTQSEVAKSLGIKQNAVSQLEQRTDTYVSTLRRFMKSLGMTLEFSVVDKKGVRVGLHNFLPDLEKGSIIRETKAVNAVVSSSVARKSAASVIYKKKTVGVRK